MIEIADNVSIGHNVCVHGARIDANCLIGINSVLLDHVHVGEGSIVGAGSVVLQGTKIEPGSLYAGTPAKRIKSVEPEQTREMIENIAQNYIMYAGWFRNEEPS